MKSILVTPFTPKECIRLTRKFSGDELEDLDTIYGSKWLGKYNFWIGNKPFGVKYVRIKAIRPVDILGKLIDKKVSYIRDDDNYKIKIDNKSIESDISFHDLMYRAAIHLLEDVK